MVNYMNSLIISILLVGALLMHSISLNAESESPNKNLQEARLLVKTFGGDLKSVLTTAMKVGGPIKALEVCNLQAEPIAEKISSSSGWHVGRTSLKVRNIDNEPDEWELKTLLEFESRKAAGEELNKLEYSEVINDGNKTVLRYMKPIPTVGLCVTCHGNVLNDDLSKKVKLLYPSDKATGFNVGDIRGAFSLQKVIK